MQDPPPPTPASSAPLREELERLFEVRSEDPHGTRAEVRRLVEAAHRSGVPAERACVGPGRAIDAAITVRLGEHEEALRLSRDALRHLVGSEDSASELRAANIFAESLMQLSRLEEARDFLVERAARAEAREELHAGHVSLYMNLAGVSFYLGSPAGALQPLGRALELATSLEDESCRALILGNFGNLYGQLGDHRKSLESHQACAATLRGLGETRHLANCLHNIGVQLHRLGDSEGALAIFEESLSLRDTGDDPSKIAKTELDRAYSLVTLERLDEAELAIERALELHRRTGSKRQEALALTSLARVEAERGRFREAIARHLASEALLDPLEEPTPSLNNRLGIIEAHLALDEHDRALELLESTPDPEAASQLSHLYRLRMLAHERAGMHDRALHHAQRRIELLEQLHARDAQRTIENLQGVHQVELLRQRERDQSRVRAELEALVAERARQLIETNAELEARVDELVRAEYARSRLEEELRQAQKMDAIGRLAGGVAHDFNNLLTVILGRGELLLEELTTEHPGHESLREMMEAASRAARLTVQLLAFGRKQALRPTRLDVGLILDDLRRLLSRLLGERIEIEVRHDPHRGSEHEPLHVLADRGQLEQVFINLAINARDAMPKGGRLTFKASRIEVLPGPLSGPTSLPPGDYVSIQVTDTGEGMTPDYIDQVFEPFFTTKELGKGTGLGLSTVHGIVHQSGGTITVESTPGLGSTFEVRLPATDSSTLEADETASGSPASSAPLRVLVVEDDAGLRRVMREGLGRRGYEILEASDGATALGLAHDVDLVVCDRILPRMSGLDVINTLRKARPQLPCLLISGHPTSEEEEASEADIRFLSKPFKLEVLLRVLADMQQ